MSTLLARKVINSYFSPKFYWRVFVRKYKFNKDMGFFEGLYHKVTSRLWFYPSIYSSRFWSLVEDEGSRNYKTFTVIDKKAEFFINKLREEFPKKSENILDIGCNVGRFLNALAEDGYTSLTGIDINEFAIKNSNETYPLLIKVAKMHRTTFQEFLLKERDNAYEYIYSYGATVELVHPTFPLVKNITRIARKKVCLFISERQAYPRLWEIEFKRHGFELMLKESWCHQDPDADCESQTLYLFVRKQ